MSLRADHRVYVAARQRGASPRQAVITMRQARAMRRMIVSLGASIENFGKAFAPAVNRTARAIVELQQAIAKGRIR